MPNQSFAHLDSSEIRRRSPRSGPYHLLDHVEILESDLKFRAIKNVTACEPYFAGHFPAHPVMPGVLQLDAMRQLVEIGLFVGDDALTGLPYISRIDKVKFRRPIGPGDQLLLEAEVVEEENNSYRCHTTIGLRGETASEATFKLRVDPIGLIAAPSPFSASAAGLTNACGEDEINIRRIISDIPHRYPFIMVDRILNHNSDRSTMNALKNVTLNETHSLAEYNNQPFLPNSLQPEIVAQAGCFHLLNLPENKDKNIFFMSIDHAIFHRVALPGEQLVISVHTTAVRGRFGKAMGKVFSGEELVSEMSIKFAIVPNE